MKNTLLRAIPSVDELATSLKKRISSTPWPVLVRVARDTISQVREEIMSEGFSAAPEKIESILNEKANRRLSQMRSPVPTINATGVILHTGLGRAPLAPRAVKAICEVAASYSTLEINRDTGDRQSRLLYADELLRAWTGAESTTVLNNNAAATFLCLHELAKDRKVIIARAQMVEIGGSFRLPDILDAAGVRMVEVGTTNKVRLSDYEKALDEETALIIKVHSSNYRIVGFTEFPSIEELAHLGRKHRIPVLYDIGSGAGKVWKGYIAPDEPIVQETVAAGADLISFSGDKLLGGPQAGIVAGRAHLVDRLKSNPLARAFRVDKLALAALATTLELYLDGEDAVCKALPIFSAVSDSPDTVRQRGEQFRKLLGESGDVPGQTGLAKSIATIGGGSVPGEEIPSWAVTFHPDYLSVTELSKRLRQGDPPVFGFIADDLLHLDMRTVFDHELPLLASSVRQALKTTP